MTPIPGDTSVGIEITNHRIGKSVFENPFTGGLSAVFVNILKPIFWIIFGALFKGKSPLQSGF